MKNCKLSVTIVLGCLCMAAPAKAFWPVSDIPELIGGVFPQVTTALKNLSELDTQLAKMTENLKAIGETQEAFAQFGKSLYGGTCSQTAENTAQTVDKAYASNAIVQDKIVEIANNVNDVHKKTINSVVDKTEQELKIAALDKTSSIQLAQNDLTIRYMEEDEEEAEDVNKEKQDIQNYFNNIKEQNQDLYIKMNDVFESSIMIMNKSADLNQRAFLTLKKAIQITKQEITAEERKKMQERTEILLNTEQENSDLGISLMEEMQADYSKQYQEKVADSLNNYQNMVLAYLDGNVTAQELQDAGSALKEKVNTINTIDNNAVFAQYNKENKNVLDETNKLVSDIKTWEEKENS